MRLLTLIPTANKDGEIQQENWSTSCKDGSKYIHDWSSTTEVNKECEYSSTLQYIAKQSLQLERIRNGIMSIEYPLSELMLKQRMSEYLQEFDMFDRWIKDKLQAFNMFHRREKDKLQTFNMFHRSEKDKLQTFNMFHRSEKDKLEDWDRMIKDKLEDFDRRIKVLEEYREKEKRKQIREMILMMLFLILITNINENNKGRKTSCRKYPCLNSILFLLWQSGDVEANPGPPKSITYRNWLYDVCSVVSKVIVGVSADCKMKKIWQKLPKNWPSEELYFDPRNSNRSLNEVETFLQTLIQCCDDNNKLPHEIISEIDTWNYHKSKENGQLLNMYTSRVCCRSAEKNVKVLRSHLLVDEVLKFEVDTGIQVILSGQPAKDQQFPTHKIYRAEATRKIASFLCRILKGKDPAEKSDHIWKEKPIGWSSDCRFYNPYNGGKRCAENEDARLVKELITLCEKNSITLPKIYKDMLDAWIADDQLLLSKLITRHIAETDVKKAIMKLHEERLLQDSKIDKFLKELGLLVQFSGTIQNGKSQKRKMVNTMNKHETKRSKQSDHEDAVDTTLKELLPDCSIGQLLDNQSDSSLLDMISQNIPDFLEDAADDIQFHWT